MDLERYPTENYLLWCRANPDVSDKIGAYADHLYCDTDFQYDFLGDWAHDYVDTPQERIALWEAVKEKESSFTVACDRLIQQAKEVYGI
jgi:hypothetical protein